jgi:GNAT superfamily N-acetyltransferase
MFKIRNVVSFSLLCLFLSLSFIPSAFSFGEYEDRQGHHISFRFLQDEAATADAERKVFIASFDDNYSVLKPQEVKPHFEKREDVAKWLDGVFTDEWEYMKNAKHPVKLVDILKDDKLIGLAFVEQWGEEKETLHIRQMAILADEQRHGYGSALIEALKKQPDWPVNKMIADTRKLNKKGRSFFGKVGFKEREAFDPELAETGNYLGIEWKKE